MWGKCVNIQESQTYESIIENKKYFPFMCVFGVEVRARAEKQDKW